MTPIRRHALHPRRPSEIRFKIVGDLVSSFKGKGELVGGRRTFQTLRIPFSIDDDFARLWVNLEKNLARLWVSPIRIEVKKKPTATVNHIPVDGVLGILDESILHGDRILDRIQRQVTSGGDPVKLLNL